MRSIQNTVFNDGNCLAWMHKEEKKNDPIGYVSFYFFKVTPGFASFVNLHLYLSSENILIACGGK